MSIFDPTRLNETFFTLLLLAIWVVTILAAVRAVRLVARDGFARRKVSATIAALVVLAAIFYTRSETVYRPKTVLQPNNTHLDRTLERIESEPLPEVKPPASTTPSAQEQAEKNRRENEAAREAFEALPEKK